MRTLLLLAFFATSPFAFSNTITVSNNPNSPGQYTDLDAAVADANPGDILLVSGSLKDYNTHGATGGSFTLNKPLILYGQGYDPRKDQALSSYISIFHITSAAAGSIIAGFSFDRVFEDAGTDNINVLRCKLNGFGYNYGGNGGNGINGKNQIWRENIMGSVLITENASSIIIQNNLITGVLIGSNKNTNVSILNNYFSKEFTGGFDSYRCINNIANATISNNIFYHKSTASTANVYIATTVANCIINNNIYFNSTNDNPLSLGINFNTGSNNKNANPDFVNIDFTSYNVTRSDNFNLKAGSIAHNGGTDGKDAGPEGGNTPIQYPYSGAPSIPQIKTMTILNPVIPPNGTLKVHLKAKANN